MKDHAPFCEDERLTQKFYDCVEFYRDLFTFKEGEYNSKDVEAILSLVDAKGPDALMVHSHIVKTVSVAKPQATVPAQKEPAVSASPPTLVKAASKSSTESVSRKVKNARKKEKKQKNVKTQEEILKEEEEQEKAEREHERKQVEDLSQGGFQVVLQKNNSKVKNKVKKYGIQYIGLRVDEEDPEYVVEQFIKSSLQKLSQKFPELAELYENYSKIDSLGWKMPSPPYHITSLFVNRDKKKLDQDEYLQFKEGVFEQISMKGFFLVEDFIMTSIAFPRLTRVENKIPHMTLLIKEGKAYDSNAALETMIFSKKFGPS
eukprot:CAMPEP_0168333156 /NCGR_PEP_ID=MMETSP0213-20121227/9419_1 /TAXON_ID=151035 /ORGANISM="Euplotes harpa, Strain FSP1.4" /LENGTH=316 /DNA_ID=CAMNT_0008337385 /DNA_START=287 /DNA_END=1233 /DNA_ORIENTATION=+